MIPMVSIIGKSGSGKTTLIERLIPALRELGLRVATIKHDAHRFDIDYPGKDSWRHKKAGAEAVVISSAGKLALIQNMSGDLPPEEVQRRYLRDVDLIITEGYKTGSLPKVEVHRRARSTELLSGSSDNLIAIATDEPLDVDVPCFDLNDMSLLAKFLRDFAAT